RTHPEALRLSPQLRRLSCCYRKSRLTPKSATRTTRTIQILIPIRAALPPRGPRIVLRRTEIIYFRRLASPGAPTRRGRQRAGPAANSNNNVRGDMPFDEPCGERLQRSSQLAVVLLGHRHCQGRAPHSFATIEARRAPHSITRLQR